MGKEGGKVLQLVEEAEIVALAEPVAERMKEAAAMFKGAAQYSDYNEMLKKEKLDIVRERQCYESVLENKSHVLVYRCS